MTPKTFTHEDFTTTTGDGEPAASIFTPPLLLDTDVVDPEHYNRVMKSLADNHRTRREARQVQIIMEEARQDRERAREPYTAKRLKGIRREIETEAKMSVPAGMEWTQAKQLTPEEQERADFCEWVSRGAVKTAILSVVVGLGVAIWRAVR